MPTAVKAPAAGVCAPASKLTTDRAKPPVTGKPPVMAAPTLQAPKATSSRSGSMRWRRLAASVWPTETDSTKPTTLINKAGMASSFNKAISHSGPLKGGKPAGTVPTILTPAKCHSKCQVKPADTAIPATGPALANTSAKRTGKPQDNNKGLSPRRAQNKNATMVKPMAEVMKCICPAAERPNTTLS